MKLNFGSVLFVLTAATTVAAKCGGVNGNCYDGNCNGDRAALICEDGPCKGYQCGYGCDGQVKKCGEEGCMGFGGRCTNQETYLGCTCKGADYVPPPKGKGKPPGSK